MRTTIQRFARTLLVPFTIVIFAGLLLGIVTLLQNPDIVGETISNADGVQNFIGVIRAMVDVLFDLLPILFAIGVATGMANEDKEVSGFSVVIAFLLYHTVISYLLQLNGITGDTTTVEYLMGKGNSEVQAYQMSAAYEVTLGVFTYRMNIFGGILIGLWTAFIHNRYHTQKLPVAFSFFSGNRFVPIAILITVPFLSVASYFVWPYVNDVINGLGDFIGKTGAFGTFLYGFAGRILTPTGLHHILNQMIRFTPIGGTAEVDGQVVSGALSIFNAQMASGNPDLGIMKQATQYLSQGYHPIMLFGLPAVCLAMYHTAYPEQRKKIKGMLIAISFTSFATGITEPIEFAFIFISPLLWVFHAVMSGLAFMIMSLLGVIMGNAMGGFVDFAIFGILQGTYTKWPIAALVGIVFAFIYYYVFKFAILKFDIKTPGRDDNFVAEEEKDERKNYQSGEVGNAILKALGGKENIIQIDNCISRLRLVVKDSSITDEKELKETGSMGVFIIDDENVQVVYGSQVEHMARELKDAVKNN